MIADKTQPLRKGTVYFTVCDTSADIKSPDSLTLTFISYSSKLFAQDRRRPFSRMTGITHALMPGNILCINEYLFNQNASWGSSSVLQMSAVGLARPTHFSSP